MHNFFKFISSINLYNFIFYFIFESDLYNLLYLPIPYVTCYQSTHEDWLPGWLYAHFDHIQVRAYNFVLIKYYFERLILNFHAQLSLTSYWNESQKIVMDLSIQKVNFCFPLLIFRYGTCIL